MKKIIFLLTVLLATPVWADDGVMALQKQVATQEREIHFLTERFEGMQAALIQEHEERVASLSVPISSSAPNPQETPSQAWDRIHAESQRNETEIQTENNHAEIYRMEHGY